MQPVKTITNSPWHWLSYTQGENHSEQNWYWLPGWSFDVLVFESLIAQLPGQHWGMRWSDDRSSFDDCARQLAQTAKPDGIWVGWSLGGALAMRATSILAAGQQQNAKTVVTVATGRRFCRPTDDSSWGMEAAVFATFQQELQQQPQQTLKRFRALCAQGSTERKILSGLLAELQLPAAEHNLAHNLAWLGEYDLAADQQLLDQSGVPHWHVYAAQDSLAAGGLTPAISLGDSHSLMLESETQPLLLQRLNAILL
jgi:malonyl-CoA O-methyltransferase